MFTGSHCDASTQSSIPRYLPSLQLLIFLLTICLQQMNFLLLCSYLRVKNSVALKITCSPKAFHLVSKGKKKKKKNQGHSALFWLRSKMTVKT